MSSLNNLPLDPELQRKSVEMGYPEFCLLLGALSDAIHDSEQYLARVDSSDSWEGKVTPAVAAERLKLSQLKTFLSRLVGEA